MRFEVLLTAGAVRDLQQIDEWIATQDSPARAVHVVGRIEAAVAALARYPARGAHPRELLALGIREFRETFFKPYRIIYRVERTRVFVHLIADGRRDMQTLLAHRLLGA